MSTRNRKEAEGKVRRWKGALVAQVGTSASSESCQDGEAEISRDPSSRPNRESDLEVQVKLLASGFLIRQGGVRCALWESHLGIVKSQPSPVLVLWYR